MSLPAEVLEEIEILREVYEDSSVRWDHGEEGSILGVVHFSCLPKTGGQRQRQFVRAEIALELLPGYPAVPPNIRVMRSSGIGDADERVLLKSLDSLAQELDDCPMLVSLVEAAFEGLTALNTAGECSVCLDGFEADFEDAIVRTEPCWHRFHAECLAKVWGSAVDAALDKQRASAGGGGGGGGEGGGGCGGEDSYCGPHDSENPDRSATSAASDEQRRRDRVYGLFSAARPANYWRSMPLSCPACRTSLKALDHPAIAPYLDTGREASTTSLRDLSALPPREKMKPAARSEAEDAAEADVGSSALEDAILPGDVFECVHYKGNHFRRKAGHWDSKIPGGFVPKGFHGVVAEWDGGDYIRPEDDGVEGHRGWLALCGRSSGCGQWKMVITSRPLPTGGDQSPPRYKGEAGEAVAGAPSDKARREEARRKAEERREKAAREREAAKERQRLKRALKDAQRQSSAPSDISSISAAGAKALQPESGVLRLENAAVVAAEKRAADGGESSLAQEPVVAPSPEPPPPTPMNAKERRKYRREVQRHAGEGSGSAAAASTIALNQNKLAQSIAVAPAAEPAAEPACKTRHVAQAHIGWSVSLLSVAQSSDTEGGFVAGAAWRAAAEVAEASRVALSARTSDHNRGKGVTKATKDASAAALSREMFRSCESARMDARLLVDYQAILDGHCKYVPHLLCGAMDWGIMERLAADLEARAASGGMVEWSRHLKHEDPTWSPTFNEVWRVASVVGGRLSRERFLNKGSCHWRRGNAAVLGWPRSSGASRPTSTWKFLPRGSTSTAMAATGRWVSTYNMSHV